MVNGPGPSGPIPTAGAVDLGALRDQKQQTQRNPEAEQAHMAKAAMVAAILRQDGAEALARAEEGSPFAVLNPTMPELVNGCLMFVMTEIAPLFALRDYFDQAAAAAVEAQGAADAGNPEDETDIDSVDTPPEPSWAETASQELNASVPSAPLDGEGGPTSPTTDSTQTPATDGDSQLALPTDPTEPNAEPQPELDAVPEAVSESATATEPEPTAGAPESDVQA